MKVHLNWSATKDWDETRHKLQTLLKTEGYGNFMDVYIDRPSEILKHPDFIFELVAKGMGFAPHYYRVYDVSSQG